MVSEQAQVILQLGWGSGHMFLALLFTSHDGESGLRPFLTLLSPFLLAATKHSGLSPAVTLGCPSPAAPEAAVAAPGQNMLDRHSLFLFPELQMTKIIQNGGNSPIVLFHYNFFSPSFLCPTERRFGNLRASPCPHSLNVTTGISFM